MNTSIDKNPELIGTEDSVGRLIRMAGARPVPPPAVRDQVLAVAEAAWRGKIRVRRQRRTAYAIAATVAGFGLLFGVLNSVQQKPGPVPPAVQMVEIVSGTVLFRDDPLVAWQPLREGEGSLPEGTELSTGEDGGAALRLPGGESFRISSGTLLAFDSPGEVRLAEGTVYLDTGSRDAGLSRVQIRTPAGTVRHVGTQFEVRYGAGDLRVRVREGRALLEHISGDLRAQAGEEVRLAPSGSVSLSTIERYGAHWDWVQALSVLQEADERSVASLLEWVERETGRRVHFVRPGLKRKAAYTMLHGDVKGMMPMQALAVLLQTTDFQYTVTAEEEILIDERSL